jgi:D-sedoheptulose 7-phosphate isomerase
MDIHKNISRYLMLSSSAIQKVDLKDMDRILSVLTNSETIYTMGNGGSAATALHFALDLCKAAGKKAICLNGNMPLISAYANDDGYESIFANQLQNISRLDTVIGFSCSGNSLNVVRAIRHAKEFGAITIGFTGDDGGKLAEEASYVVKVPFEDIKIQEDAHMALCHAITAALEK